MDKYDVIVLGAGPGGYVAAIRAAQLKANVAVIECDAFGGTCLNRGCIPTKTYVKNAEILHNIESAPVRGINVGKPVVDMGKMVDGKDMVVRQLSGGVESLLKANGVKIYRGMGTVTANKTVLVASADESVEIGYDKLILATGSENFVPPIPGIDEGILTSTEILNIKEVPKSLAIIGGGVIGCEFATVFQSLGTEVTVIEMLPNLIANMDKDLSMQLQKSFKKKKIKVLANHAVNALERNENGYTVRMTDKKKDEEIEMNAEKVLISVGRKPNLKGLDSLDLEFDGRYIKVDDKLRTNVEDVYAIGDVTGKIQLAHVASAQGRVAAEDAVGTVESKCNLDVVPSCIYTLPEIGSVGMTEEAAREKFGDDIIVGKLPAVALGKALAMGETEGSYKLIAHASTKKLLGVHIFGANATDLIMEAAVVMQAGGSIDMITETIHAHPTMAEGLMEVAHEAEGLCIHMPPKK